MTRDELRAISDKSAFTLRDDIITCRAVRYKGLEDRIMLDGLLPMPLAGLAGWYAGDEDIEVLDESGATLGYLLPCRQMGPLKVNEMTTQRYAAYLNEVSVDLVGATYQFQKDYFVVVGSRYNEYARKYMASAPLWGGFVHEYTGSGLPAKYTLMPSNIVALTDLDFPTEYHLECCVRSVAEPYAFERFLKIYHLLELLFDYDVVERIKHIGDDLHGIAQLLSDYSSKDLERLTKLLLVRCTDSASIAKALGAVFQSPDIFGTAEMIFYEYRKDGNPLKEKQHFVDFRNRGGFGEADTRAVVRKSGSAYVEFIIKLAAFWIYRVRCSIAHNRIGEYVMAQRDEPFIVQFAEPLLREVVFQAFRKTT